ncbi:hypothetical protein HWI79_2859 [Cryptosporidium felis]|nr:hypothetical protein HWI79_2859 [Cryptosporidium felis]
MVLRKFLPWVLVLWLLLCTLGVSKKNEKLENAIVSYVSGIDDRFYPFIPQLFLAVGREVIIKNYFTQIHNLFDNLQEKVNILTFNNIKKEFEEARNSSSEDLERLMERHNITFIKGWSPERFSDFHENLEEAYEKFGLDRATKIFGDIQVIGRELEKIGEKNLQKLEDIEKRWETLLEKAETKGKGNESVLEFKKKVNLVILENLVIRETPKKRELNIEEFNSEFSNKFWSDHLSHKELLTLLQDYKVYQLRTIYKLKIIWLRIVLTVGVIETEEILIKVHSSATDTMVHSVSITSLQHLYQIKNRIDSYLSEGSTFYRITEIYNSLFRTINNWIYLSLVLDDLQFLYTHLMREGLEIHRFIMDTFEKTKWCEDLELESQERVENRKRDRAKSGFLGYLLGSSEITGDLEEIRKIFNEKSFYSESLEKRMEIDNLNEESRFKKMMEEKVKLELEELVITNHVPIQNHLELVQLIEISKLRFEKFARQSNIFLEELRDSSQSCQNLYFSASQAGNSLYEIIANEMLDTSSSSGKVDVNSNTQLKNLIKDLESVKESIDSVKEAESIGVSDIFGEMISDEDFIYVPGTLGNQKKSRSGNRNLAFRISVIVGLFILVVVLYIYKDKILERRQEGSKDSNANERYCSRVSLDEIEFNSSSRNEDKIEEVLRRKSYKIDNKSGNIILKQK